MGDLLLSPNFAAHETESHKSPTKQYGCPAVKTGFNTDCGIAIHTESVKRGASSQAQLLPIMCLSAISMRPGISEIKPNLNRIMTGNKTITAKGRIEGHLADKYWQQVKRKWYFQVEFESKEEAMIVWFYRFL